MGQEGMGIRRSRRGILPLLARKRIVVLKGENAVEKERKNKSKRKRINLLESFIYGYKLFPSVWR